MNPRTTPPGGATPQTLAQLLDWRCARSAGKDALVWLKDGLDVDHILHFGALRDAARSWALALIAVSRPGDRVLLIMPPGLGFAVVFWGCLMSGRIAVPMPAPDASRRKNLRNHVDKVMADAQAAVIITTAEFAAQFDTVGSTEAERPHLLLADRAGKNCAPLETAAKLDLPEIRPDQPAYLQYTSGSTGTPRGVVLTHRSVLAQCEAAARAVVLGADGRLLSWLPHHHDFGLVLGIIAPVYAGATSFLMSPMSFLRRPLRWLEALSRHRISHTGAPNFALAACVREIANSEWQGDLSSLRSLSCGAEPIRAATLRAFTEGFAGQGLSAEVLAPAYGMAEVVLCATVAPPGRGARIGRAGEGSEWVSCGRAIDGLSIAIVDAAGRRCRGEGETGEIWLRGDSVGSGYWGAAEATATVFSARLDDGSGPWLRTGDLGFFDQHELVVTGRLKDLLILNGRNLPPQDIEWTAQRAVPALREGYGAAFAVDGLTGEGAVLVQEVDRRLEPADAIGVARAIREALWAEHELALHDLVLVRSGSLPRTSSGKLRRSAAREAYLGGQLEHIGLKGRDRRAIEPNSTAARVAVLWAETLRSTPDDLNDRFFDLGGDSLAATRLASRIGATFGIEWGVAEVFRRPSLGEMAAAIECASKNAVPAGERPERAGLPKRLPRQGDLPVTSSQRRMWMVQQLTPGTTAYNMGFAFRVEGRLCAANFERAFSSVVARHEAFRTRLVAVGDDLVQRIDDTAPLALQREDFESIPAAERERVMQQCLGEFLQTAFDLEAGPLHRALLVRMRATDHVLMWSIHHAIADLWSFALLFEALSAEYAAIEAGVVPQAIEPGLDYADYAAWLREPAQQAALEPEVEYWTTHLRGLTPLALPGDRVRHGPPSGLGGRITMALPQGWRQRIRAQSRAQGVTPFMLLLAVFQLQLSRCCGQNDVAVGTPIANRQRLAAERLVGTLVNTVVMRTALVDVRDFPELLERVRDVAIAAYAHQEAPFERLVERLVDTRETHAPPLVQVLFNLVAAPFDHLNFAGRRIGPVDVERTGAQFDLSLSVDLDVFGQLHLEYASDRFSRASAMQWADGYLHLLGQVLDDSSLPLGDYVIRRPAAVEVDCHAPHELDKPTIISAAASSTVGWTTTADVARIEAVVLLIASEVLGFTVTDALDNFFDVGGHSLLALRFAHRLHEVTGYRPGVLAIAQSSFRALGMAALESQSESPAA